MQSHIKFSHTFESVLDMVPTYCGSLTSPSNSISALFSLVIVKSDLKLCVNNIGLGKEAKLSTKAVTIGRFPQHFGG
jgi:hypothetical protein